MPSVSLGETSGQAIGDAAAHGPFDGLAPSGARNVRSSKSARSRTKIRHKEIKAPAQQNQSPVQQNPNPSQRKPNRSSFHDSRLLNRLAPISARVWGCDICATGPLSSKSRARATNSPFFRSGPLFCIFGKKMSDFRKAIRPAVGST